MASTILSIFNNPSNLVNRSPVFTRAPMITRLMIICVLAMGIIMTWPNIVYVLLYFENLYVTDTLDLGGDYRVYWGGVQAAFAGDAVHLYNAEWLNTHLVSLRPYDGDYGYYWQYPPSYLLFVSPFGVFSYPISVFVWFFANFSFALWALKTRLGLPWTWVAMLAISPFTYLGIVNAQNGFLVAALMICAIDQPKSKPIIAGICAGLLTFKPHLGVLIPFAYLSGGCWRAFGWAAVTTIGTVIVSGAIFGFDAWLAFINGLSVASDRLSTSDLSGETGYPVDKMLSIFAVLYCLGVSASLAMSVQILSAIAAIAACVWVWSRGWDVRYKTALTCCLALMVPPYVYHYDMTMLLYPVVLMIILGLRDGVLPYEEIGLAAAGLIMMFYTGLSDMIRPILLFSIPITLFVLVCRRARLEERSQLIPCDLR